MRSYDKYNNISWNCPYCKSVMVFQKSHLNTPGIKGEFLCCNCDKDFMLLVSKYDKTNLINGLAEVRRYPELARQGGQDEI